MKTWHVKLVDTEVITLTREHLTMIRDGNIAYISDWKDELMNFNTDHLVYILKEEEEPVKYWIGDIAYR